MTIQPNPIRDDGSTEIWIRPPFTPDKVRIHLKFLTPEGLERFEHQVQTLGMLFISPPICTRPGQQVELVLESARSSMVTPLPSQIDHHSDNATAIYMDMQDPWVRQALRSLNERAFIKEEPKSHKPPPIDLMAMVREARSNQEATPEPTPSPNKFNLMAMVREAQTSRRERKPRETPQETRPIPRRTDAVSRKPPIFGLPSVLADAEPTTRRINPFSKKRA